MRSLAAFLLPLGLSACSLGAGDAGTYTVSWPGAPTSDIREVTFYRCNTPGRAWRGYHPGGRLQRGSGAIGIYLEE
ncbi:MAG: hypothetical protein ACOCXR_00185 [Phototrophicaceae bacterium]